MAGPKSQKQSRVNYFIYFYEKSYCFSNGIYRR